MNKLPSALRPLYTTAKPNEKILLYDGSLEISFSRNQRQIQIQGSGTLEYVWFPNPHIQFNFSNQEKDITNGLPT